MLLPGGSVFLSQRFAERMISCRKASGFGNYLNTSNLVPPSTSTSPIIALSNKRLKVYESRCQIAAGSRLPAKTCRDSNR
jgi:hypothetical protein